jgi:integrase
MRNKAVWLFVRWRENGKQVARAAEWEVDNVVLKHIPEGRVFWLKWLDGKQQRYLRVGTDPVEAVKAYIHQTRVNVYGPRPVAPAPVAPERVTVQQAIVAYLEQLERDKSNERSRRSKSFELGEFRKFCTRTYIDEITHDDMVDFREHLYAQEYADVTVYNKLITCVTWLRHNPLLPRTKLLKFPDDFPDKPETKPEPYSEAEIAALRRCANPREHLILSLFLATGCREQEIGHLEFSDLNVRDRLVRIQKKPHFHWKPKTKAGTRDIPISPALMAELCALGTTGLLFPNDAGQVEQHFLRMFQSIGRRAGVERVKCHRFRDTFCTERVKRAKTMDELMTVAVHMGHRDLGTIRLYARLIENTSNAAREAAEHMDNYGAVAAVGK